MILDVIRALGRRWYVLIAGLLLTAGLAYGAYSTTPPEYSARGLVLFLPPADSLKAGGNPFLNLSGLEQPASIVVGYFASTTAREDITSRAPRADFDVAIDSSTRGPVIAVEVTDKSAEETLSALTYISDQIPVQLQRLQQEVNVPAGAMITSMPLVTDVSAEVDRAATIRMVIVACVVGLVTTGIATFLLDGMLMSRRARRGDLAATMPPTGHRDVAPERSRPDAGDRRRRLGVSSTVETGNLERSKQVRVNSGPSSARVRRES